MAYLHIDCVHIVHYFVHIAGLHIAYLQIACVHNAYLDIACVRSKTRCYTGRHEHMGTGQSQAVRCLCVCPEYCVHALWCKQAKASFLCRGAYKWRYGLHRIEGLMLFQTRSQMCMS